MSDYRLYHLDDAGHIDRADTFAAAGDEDAVAHAAHKSGGEPFELWCGSRMVAKTSAEGR